MVEKVFTSVPVRALSNNDSFALFKSTIDYVEPYQGELGDVGKAIYDLFRPKVVSLGISINNPRRSKFSDEIKQYVTNGKARIKELVRDYKTASKSSNAQKKKAGETLQFFFEPHRDLEKAQKDTFSTGFKQMMNKFHADQHLQESARIIGIEELINELSSISNSLDQLLKAESLENSVMGETRSTDERLEAAVLYIQFCIAIEQKATFKPSDNILKLFVQLDELRRRYQSKSSRSKAEAKQTDAQAK